MLTSRRNFLGLLAAPAIVRASSLMKVVPIPEVDWAEQIELDYVADTMSTSAQYQAAVRRALNEEILPIMRRYLVPYQPVEKIALR